jgi:copper ion binding protein
MIMETNITVSGMTCGHCANSVSKEITSIDGVSNVVVDVATGKVTITSSAQLDATQIAAAVEEAGYQVV